MAEPNKEVELQGDWEAAGVSIEIPKVNPAAAKAMKRKRQHSAFKASASGTKGPARDSREETADGKKVAESTSLPTVHNADAASPAPQAEIKHQPAQNAIVNAAVGPGTEEQRLRDEMDARLRAQGWLPFVADLEAMKRVYSVGLDLFRRMSEDVPAEMARVLRGKIAAYSFENHRMAGELEKIQAELNSQRDERYLNLSSENRELREQAEKTQQMREELDGARKKIAEQVRQLEALPGIRADKEKAAEAEKKAREEAESLKRRIEELAAEKAEIQKKSATAHAGGYQKALDLSFTLAPWLHEHSAFFDGKHHGNDGKVWLGNQVVFEPPPEAEDEEEENPADEGEIGQ